MPDGLYDRDFLAWTQQQARALRDAVAAGSSLPLDWANLIEEVEDLGSSQRLQLGSRIRTIVEHLLRLEHSPAQNPRRGWEATVNRSRVGTEVLLQASPSLRDTVADQVEHAMRRVPRIVADQLATRGESRSEEILATRYTPEQVLDDWFPPPPA